MTSAQVWEILINSPKVIRVKNPAFLIDLENGQLVGHLHPEDREHDYVKPLMLSTKNLDVDFSIVLKILENNDFVYIKEGEMDDVFKKNIVASDLKTPGTMSVNFIRYGFRCAAVTKSDLKRWYDEMVESNRKINECKAEKNN